jgi:hypothetical protein
MLIISHIYRISWLIDTICLSNGIYGIEREMGIEGKGMLYVLISFPWSMVGKPCGHRRAKGC